MTCPRFLFQLEVESRGVWDLLVMCLEQLMWGPERHPNTLLACFWNEREFLPLTEERAGPTIDGI